MVDPELIDILTTFKGEMVSFMNEMRSEMTSFKDEMRSEMTSFRDEMHSEMTSFKDEMRSEMTSFKDEMRSEMTSFKDEMRSEMTSFRNEVNDRFNMVEDKLNRVNDTCTLIQYDHGKKLEAIFDYIKEDIEKHEHYKNHSNQVDAKLEDHSIRLSIIESTGAYKSALELMRQENLGKAT